MEGIIQIHLTMSASAEDLAKCGIAKADKKVNQGTFANIEFVGSDGKRRQFTTRNRGLVDGLTNLDLSGVSFNASWEDGEDDTYQRQDGTAVEFRHARSLMFVSVAAKSMFAGDSWKAAFGAPQWLEPPAATATATAGQPAQAPAAQVQVA